jgi:hypothetical protein
MRTFIKPITKATNFGTFQFYNQDKRILDWVFTPATSRELTPSEVTEGESIFYALEKEGFKFMHN